MTVENLAVVKNEVYVKTGVIVRGRAKNDEFAKPGVVGYEGVIEKPES